MVRISNIGFFKKWIRKKDKFVVEDRYNAFLFYSTSIVVFFKNRFLKVTTFIVMLPFRQLYHEAI